MNKKSLTATFKDMAGMPVRLVTETRELYVKNEDSAIATNIATGVMILCVIGPAVSGFVSSGIGFGILLPYLASNIFAAMVCTTNAENNKKFYPNYTEYKENQAKADMPPNPSPGS